ncbi:hypothetical protein MON38_01190 [Hymenobacter sp. DH14]|uniref:Lipocalin-like domain-containing protein n=1 Tax=Hymenobacter cyanobacteriorum TaxID=2926463 RepID=A0A9X1VBY4_9BACT|nr:hypothetical protein [Hymenobacter cyanobacteriorum]MCI1186016.1 hypothetical protein [Hymenobacter cyanobacteriorum]
MVFVRNAALLLGLLSVAIGQAAAQVPTSTAVQAPAPLRLIGHYRYTGYTVFDAESPNEPTAVRGVGGTLLLRPDGTYAKRLTLALGTRTVSFSQDGTYALAGDSIRFAFRDQKGPDVQRGTARLDSTGRHLTLTILGYPAGNQGVYELEAAPAEAVAAPVVVPAPSPRPAPRKKRRR